MSLKRLFRRTFTFLVIKSDSPPMKPPLYSSYSLALQG